MRIAPLKMQNVRGFRKWMGGVAVALLLWATDACVTMPQAHDTTAPTLLNFSVNSFSVLSGTVLLAVEASDNRGTAQVEFLLDESLITRLTTAPFRYAWDTRGTSDGVHLLSVVARDLAGNSSRIDRWVSILNGGGHFPPFVQALASLNNQTYATSVVAQRGQTVYFRAEAFDPDGGAITSVSWDFGDGTPPATGQSVAYAYGTAGTFTARVTVRDDEGAESAATVAVTVEAATGAPVITQFSVTPTSFQFSGSPVTVNVSASAYDPDGSAVTYEWNFGDGSPGSSDATTTHSYTAVGPNYRITLTVRDAQNETATRSDIVTVSGLPLLGMADDFHTTDENGLTFRLSERRGNVILLNFWATWCIPCREEFPILEALHQTYRAQGFLLIGVDTSDLTQPSQLRAWKQNNSSITYPLILDKGSQYHDIYLLFHDRFDSSAPQSLPYTVLIDRGGGVRWTKVAKLQDGEVDSLLSALLPISGS
jgi:thiol-disulfide isomerase/thioredoxin